MPFRSCDEFKGLSTEQLCGVQGVTKLSSLSRIIPATKKPGDSSPLEGVRTNC